MPVDHYSIVRYRGSDGARCGVLHEGKVYEAEALGGDRVWRDVVAILERWAEAQARFADGMARGAAAGVPLASVELLAPLDRPAAIFCAGSNFRDHAASMARVLDIPLEPDPHTVGLKPWFFLKTAHTLAAPGATVACSGAKMDWEAELAAVIGTPARDVPVERALDHVVAYTIANDLSARDRAMRMQLGHGSPFRPDWVAHKNFDGACPIGPALVPATQVGDPQDLAIGLTLNGEAKQDSRTDQMIFTLAEQIAHLSSFVTLRPGDVILTGTPAGTGTERQEFLKPGDEVTAWVEGLGELVTRIG